MVKVQVVIGGVNINIIMKFIHIIILSITISIIGCAKNGLENIPLENSFEPADKVLQHFTEKINSVPEGWEFTLSGPERGFYAGYINFGEAQHVQFLVDIGQQEMTLPKTADYSCIIDRSIATLVLRSGAYTDFIKNRNQMDSLYSILSIKQDTIYLRGQRYGNLLRLSRSTEKKASLYTQTGFKNTTDNLAKLDQLPFYFKTLIVNGASYDFNFHADQQKLYIHYGGKEQYKLHETLYSRTATGIIFKTPLVDGINVLYGIDEFNVDVAKGQLQAILGGQTAVFSNNFMPSTYDVDAAKQFINHPFHLLSSGSNEQAANAYGFSISLKGFAIGGKADALEFGKIPDYQFLTFFHRLPNLDYGSCRFIIGDDLNVAPYGPAVVPQLSGTGGFVRFNLVGQYGEAPASITAIVNKFTDYFTNSSGFWAIKSADAGYDLVSTDITGGQRWIHFE